MEAPLINNNEQKHSTVDVTDNDQREKKPQTPTCLANFSIGMLLFVSLLALLHHSSIYLELYMATIVEAKQLIGNRLDSL